MERYVSDVYAAEDIAIDVFAYVAAEPKRYHFGTSLKTYLFMLGRSRALDYIRRRSRQKELPLEQVAEQPSEEPLLEQQLLTDERAKMVHHALRALDEPMRLVVHLTYFEQMGIDEVAMVLKKNKKQIYNLLYRAKTILRSLLGQEELI